jgi:hypothetical protein
MNKIIFSYLLLLSFYTKAQQTHEEIISDRPDQTESSTVVPRKSLQIETGFVKEKIETEYIKQKSITYNNTMIRYGLFDNFELRIAVEYLKNRLETKFTNEVSNDFRLNPLFAGCKIKLKDENGVFPQMAVVGGVNVPISSKCNIVHSSAIVKIAFSHTLSKIFSLGYNLGVERGVQSAISDYLYSVALGVNLTKFMGIYVENYGIFHNEETGKNLVDAGINYIILPNFIVDLSGGLGMNDNAVECFVGFGLSFRLIN